jgi:hypothetical protein
VGHMHSKPSTPLAAIFAACALVLLSIGCGATTKDLVKGLDKTGEHVPMSTDEAAFLKAIFGPSLDVSKMKLVYGSPVATGAPKTIENTIHFDPKHDIRDPAYRRTARHLMLLAHEATHVWQFQNKGLTYIPDSLFNQAVGAVVHDDRNQAYAYDLEASKTLASYNSEQQAQIIEGYVAIKGFGFAPPRCTNFEAVGPEAFIEGAETILRRDLHEQFKGIDRELFARLTAAK